MSEFAVLRLNLLKFISDVRWRFGSLPTVALRLGDPAMQRLRRAADLARDQGNRRPSRAVFAFVIQRHPNGPRAHFRRKRVRRFADGGSILSGVGASGKSGAVHRR